MSARPLAGRGAVITGGGRGIGAAVALVLANAGARVVVSSRTAHEIELVAGALRTMGAEAHAIPCDVADEESVRLLAAEAVVRMGAVDLLINNAGDSGSAPFRRITLAEWNRMLAVNATGTFLCTREMAPPMVERKFGRIVNVASRVGLEGGRYVSHYSAAKHAVIGFTRSVALELAGTGVTANAVCPGYVDTPMTQRTIENTSARMGVDAEQALAAVLASGGQSRLVTAEEVANEVLALCTGDSNGAAVLMDGGAMEPEIVNPEALGAPKGFSHGVLTPHNGRVLFVAGQPGWDGEAPGPRPGFPEQFARSLDRVLAVVKQAGGEPSSIGRLTVYVTDLAAYKMARPALAKVWGDRFGRYYPAMALIEVKNLVDRGALVEIEATAVIGDAAR